MLYQPLILRFNRRPEPDAFWLEVRQTPASLPGATFRLDAQKIATFRLEFSELVALSQFWYRYPRQQLTNDPNARLAALGQALYQLLPDPFRLALPRVLQTVFEQGHGVRLVLEASAEDDADHLLTLPWEILYAVDLHGYLGHNPRVLITRRVIDAPRRSPLSFVAPHNVTHIIAHTDQPSYQIDDALQAVERQAIAQAVGAEHYQQVEQVGSVARLLATVTQQSAQIVHFLGHGTFFTQGGQPQGQLCFVTERGDIDYVTGERLQHLLSFDRSVQLVVLNACQSGSGAGTSVALSLVLPYVVAMQSDILQDAARHFIDSFYRELQRNRPIDEAVAMGRAMVAAQLPNTMDWCLPVLYTNTGLAEQPPLQQVADETWHWAGRPETKRILSQANIGLGLIQLLIGLFAIVNGLSFAAPTPAFLLYTSLTMFGLSLVIALGALIRTTRFTNADERSLAQMLTLGQSIWGSTAVGLGLTTLYGWFIIFGLVGFGLWTQLSMMWQAGVLSIVFVCASLMGYAQAMGHGSAFLHNRRIEGNRSMDDWVLPMGGYLLLFLPILLNLWNPAILTAPTINLYIGILTLGIGYLLRENQP